MLERRMMGALPPKPHTVFQHAGTTLSEFVFTRDGFSGGFSILYMNAAPTALREVRLYSQNYQTLLGTPVPHAEVANARRHIKTQDLPLQKNFISARTALFRNSSCRISSLKVEKLNPQASYAFCNGDADELYFIFEGHGELLTMFGKLPFKKNDYVLIPRGVGSVWTGQTQLEALIIEGDPHIEIPQNFRNPHGQLKLEAPYTHRDFVTPKQLLSAKESEVFCHTITLKNQTLTEHLYEKSPAQTCGWDGSVYPFAFNILDYLPKTGKIHLPPNMHLTFSSPKFAVCSFVPRAVDYMEGAIPCPYPHANPSCDEVLYYVSGDFTSRAGISNESMSFHPAGVPHGPQPGKYLGSVGAKFTNEVAVMVDTWEPLQLTREALGVEDPRYMKSWA